MTRAESQQARQPIGGKGMAIRQPTVGERFLTMTRLSAVTLGFALMLWGLTPAMIFRATSGGPPTLEIIGQASIALLIGITFFGLALLIGQGRRWALWATFAAALALCTAGSGQWVLYGPSGGTAFLLILSGALLSCAWLSLKHQHPENAPST
jgi:hypothetical protein